MELKPLQGKIIVEVDDAEKKTKGGIILPETAQEKPQEGKVVAIGKTKDAKALEDVKVGKRVVFAKYSGSEIERGGKNYLIVDTDDILAVIE
jgi:chaperonin GroES